MQAAATQRADKFAILHVSDLHLSAVANLANIWDRLRPKLIDIDAVQNTSIWRLTSFDAGRSAALARFIDVLTPKVDALVLSGDLATSGLDEDINEAFTYIDSPSRPSLHKGMRVPGLGNAKEKLILIPGNHDRFEWESWRPPFYIPGGKRFDSAFRDYWCPQLRNVQSWDVGKRGKVFVLGADLCLSCLADAGGDRIASLGHGIAHHEIIEDLEEETLGLAGGRDSNFLIWNIHFFPCNCADGRLNLLDADRLLEAAERCGVHIILCGHLHTRELVSLSKNRIVFRAGTPTSLDSEEEHCFHLITIELSTSEQSAAAKVSILDFIWKREGRFGLRSSKPEIHIFHI